MMRHTRPMISTLAIGLLGALLPAQAAKPAADPDLPAQLKEFKAAIGDRKGAEDAKATGLIDQWLTKYENYASKDQDAVVKALDTALTSDRVRRPIEKTGLYTAAATALGRMDKDGAKVLKKAFKSSKFKKREWVSVRAVVLKQLGRTKDTSAIDLLVDTARRDPADQLMAAAGEALGNFAELPQKDRKDIVKDLVKTYGEVHGKANASLDPGDPQVKRSKQRLASISDPWNETLRLLTNQSFRTAPEWQKFWNKSKSADWDKK